MIHEAERSRVGDLHGIDPLPGGHAVLVIVHEASGSCALEIWDEETTRPVLAIADSFLVNPRYAEPGFILYERQRGNEGLWALPFSLADLEVTGEPFLVAPTAGNASVADDGTLIYLASDEGSDARLVWVGPDGGVEESIGQPQAEMWMPRASPDGSKILVTGEDNNDYDIWIHDVSRGTKTRLTFMDGIEGGGTWSPDGSQVFFFHPVFGENPTIYSVPADGRGDPRALVTGGSPSFTADGKWMAFVREGENSDRDLWMAAVDGSTEPEVFLATDAVEEMPRLSPDGKYLAYVSDDSGRDEIYIKPFPSGEGKWQVSIDGGYWPNWSPRGDMLLFVNEEKLHEVTTATDPQLRLSSPRLVIDDKENDLLLERSFDIAQSGERYVVIQKMGLGEDDAVEDAGRGIFVVQNWLAEFAE